MLTMKQHPVSPIDKTMKTSASFGMSFVQISISFLFILFIQILISPIHADAVEKLKEGDFELVIDQNHDASVFYKDVLLLREIGSFSVSKCGVSGCATVAAGPLKNQIISQSTENGAYLLNARHALSGVEYQVGAKWVGQGKLKIDITIDTKCSIGCFVDFGFCKLSPDIFRGARITGDGIAPTTLPLTPRAFADRFLLKDAKFLNIPSYLTDISIRPSGSVGINLADFRNVTWDRSRSFYVYSNKQPVILDKKITFSYELRFVPPSMKLEAQFQKQNISTQTSGIPDGTNFFHYPPKNMESFSGQLSLGPIVSIGGDLNADIETIFAAEISRRIPGDIRVVFSKGMSVLPGINIHLNKGETRASTAEQFELEVTSAGVDIRASDNLGCLFALQTLLDKAGIKNNTVTIPLMKVNDGPDIKIRGAIIESSSPGIKDIRYIKGYINAISRARGNTIIFLHTPKHIWSLMKGVESSKSWSTSDIGEIADYARSLGINVIPGLVSKFKSSDFPDMVKGAEQNFYNPFDDNSYKFLFAMYEFLLNIYRPTAMLIGHDEIVEIGRNAPEGWSDSKVLAFDITKIHDWLKEKGIRTLMFGDMLLDRRTWGATIAANSNSPTRKSLDTHKAIDALPTDIIILDWQYFPADDYPTIKYFKDRGFEVWGVPWYSAENAWNMAKSISKYSANGLMVSDWGLLRTMSPGATTLYALKSAWNNQPAIQGNGEDAIAALADEMRQMSCRLFDKVVFQSISIDQVANEVTRDEVIGDGRGFFDIGNGLDLRTLPEGDHILGNVHFRITPSIKDKTNNCIVVGSRYAGFLPRISIPMNNLKVNSLAFLHTMYASNPQVALRAVGKYEIVYASGKKVEIDLQENFNITDFRSSPGIRKNPWSFILGNDVLLGSNLAWRGNTLSGLPVNVQLLLWANPHPDDPIQTISIIPIDQVQICLLAISADSPQDN